MKYNAHIAVLMLLLIGSAGCDFPSDPPLKEPDDTVNRPVNPRVYGDLLPLDPDNRWVYVAQYQQRPTGSPVAVSPRSLNFRGETFSYLSYAVLPAGPSGPFQAFPSLLRNDSTGLSFYSPVNPEDTLQITRAPKYMFTLPYPTRPGTELQGSNSEYLVRVTNVDTLVNMHTFGSILLPVTRYVVLSRPRQETVFYILPEVCILRVETENYTFHTISWYLP